MKVGDIVYYNNSKNEVLNIGTAHILKIIEFDNQIRINVRMKDGKIHNGVIGVHYFLSKEELIDYFGKTEIKRKNYDVVKKVDLIIYLNKKYPDLAANYDIVNMIADCPEYDTQLYGKKINHKCSICGIKISQDNSNYCSNCGARLSN